MASKPTTLHHSGAEVSTGFQRGSNGNAARRTRQAGGEHLEVTCGAAMAIAIYLIGYFPTASGE